MKNECSLRDRSTQEGRTKSSHICIFSHVGDEVCIWLFIWRNNMKMHKESERAIKCSSSIVPLYCPNPLCYFFSQKGRRKSRYLTPVISFSLSNSILICSTESGYKESFELANHSMWNLLLLDHCMVWFHSWFRYLPTWPCMKASVNTKYKIAPLLHHSLPTFLK